MRAFSARIASTDQGRYDSLNFVSSEMFFDRASMHNPGTHLVVNFGWYRHHGISLGSGQVIHFGRGLHDLENACIEVVSEEVFSAGRAIVAVASAAEFKAEEIVERAHSRIGESGYGLFDNNCEHFVNWCRSGSMVSTQASVAETLIRQSAAAGTRSVFRRKLAAASLSRLPITLARGTATAALAADAVQAVSELAATSAGCEQQQAQRIGKRIGFGSSATLGFAMGGPAGAAVSVGFWAAGQAIGRSAVEKTQRAIRNAVT